MKKLKIMEIKWLDHYSQETGWTRATDYKVKPHMVTSVGIFVSQTAEYITLATNVDYNGLHTCMMNIMKKVITEKRVLT